MRRIHARLHRSYVFTKTGTGDDGDLEYATVAELSEAAWTRILSDCKAFQDGQGHLIQAAIEAGGAYAVDYDDAAAGRDFWFTRNGHGTGFWDRGFPGALGDKLTAACCGRSPHPELCLYRGDDGLLYLD